MAIVYKTKEKKVKIKSLDEKCPSCHQPYTLELSVWQKYFTLYWIPFIPLKKRGEINCTSCQTKFELNAVRDGEFEFDHFKRRVRAPWWTFSGIILLMIILSISILGWNRTQKEMIAFVENPKVGDVYAFKVDKADYSLYKLVRISKDSVFYLKHKTHVNLSKYLKSRYDDPNSEYNISVYGASKIEIKNWLEKGLIRKIVRQ